MVSEQEGTELGAPTREEFEDLKRAVGELRTLTPRPLRWHTGIDQRARDNNDPGADLEAHVYHFNSETIAVEIYDRPARLWRQLATTMEIDIPANFIYDHLHDAVADSDDMNIDGSGTPVNFDFTVPAGKVVVLTRINAQFRDDAKDIPNGFWSIAMLTNGLLIQIRDTDGTVLQDFDTTNDPIKNHADMIALAGVDVDSDATANKSAGGFRFTIAKTGAAMKLTAGQVVRVVVRDDLTALQEFRFMVQGIQRDA